MNISVHTYSLNENSLNENLRFSVYLKALLRENPEPKCRVKKQEL